MSYGNMNAALRQYHDIGAESGVSAAGPHRLIAMLLEGAQDRIAAAKGCMQRGEVALKGEYIGKAISLIDGLRMSLDAESGGELAARLTGLYEYMGWRLLQANHRNDPRLLDEVARLLGEIHAAWQQITPSPASSPGQIPDRTAAL
jgi:flagellar protein FliS